MNQRRKVCFTLGAAATLALGAALVAFHRGEAPSTPDPSLPQANPLSLANALAVVKPKEAKDIYMEFVARNQKSPDPEVRDRVGAARMRLGYLAAKSKDLPMARAAFLAAAKTRGTGASGAFGTVGDQAAYQAVVCLVAEGKREEARKGFETLLRERPLSPLARAAYGRLARLNDGQTKPEWDRLMQTAVAKQEANARFETSVCGPKCLERLLASGGFPLERGTTARVAPRSGVEDRGGGGQSLSYKRIAKLCGTTDRGTTFEGMRRGLKALGRESWAARLNRRDLAQARLPAILFEGDHYVLLQGVEGDAATVWDPRFASSRPWRLPPLDDPDFSATLILLAKPEGL